MTTQVIFTADRELKEKALQKAKNEGITLKALLTFCMKSFVEGDIQLGIISRDPDVEILDVPEKLQKKANVLSELLKHDPAV